MKNYLNNGTRKRMWQKFKFAWNMKTTVEDDGDGYYNIPTKVKDSWMAPPNFLIKQFDSSEKKRCVKRKKIEIKVPRLFALILKNEEVNINSVLEIYASVFTYILFILNTLIIDCNIIIHRYSRSLPQTYIEIQ